VDPNCSQSTRHLSSQLSGIRVLECGFAASAPFAGQLFHLLGADVTTVAHGARVASRWHGPEPLVLDFGNVVDFTYFKSLCVRADVVIDNFRPRVWTNLGVTPTDLGARLHLRLPGFARADERANWRSYGFQMEAHTGSGAAPWGDEQGCLSAPTFASLDHSVALFGVASTLASLKRSPHVVEVSQWTIASLAARLARRFFVRSSGE
jgi:crotonobetainyl-CoA:carnitine CoA-transferase CaiB-like acyl-CoA transferase